MQVRRRSGVRSHSVVKSVRSCELVKVGRAHGVDRDSSKMIGRYSENINNSFPAGCGRRDVPHTVPTPQSRLSQGISVLNHRK